MVYAIYITGLLVIDFNMSAVLKYDSRQAIVFDIITDPDGKDIITGGIL